MYTLSLLYIIKLMMMDFIILPIFCQIYDHFLKIHLPKKINKVLWILYPSMLSFVYWMDQGIIIWP
jgi:hypothetical protein